ncbi:MAG: hypothetical protein JJU05_02855 [Verrucomicrobia bacterium]|nr:hypothetical protein [Verrucomicrobiota bacterium]MCH8527684.1 sialate O-acetylesterase [Kiritimatiellia bacterium]
MKSHVACVLGMFVSAMCLAGENVVDLILVAGQSNAVGFDARASDLPEDPRDARVMFWWVGGDTTRLEHASHFNHEWVPLQTQPKGTPGPKGAGNFASDQGGFGPEMGFARRLLDEQPDRRLAIVKVAVNATSIHAWLPERNRLYGDLMRETNLAIEKAKERGITLRPVALLWCQGETDANRNPDTELYLERLETLVSTLRRDLDAPELIALVGFNTRFGRRAMKRNEPTSGAAAIRTAQIQFAGSSVYNVHVEDWGAQIQNSAHFSSAGTLEVGRRYAEALLETEAKLKR